MTPDLSSWLAAIGWTAFTWSLGGLLLVNGCAIAAWLWKKDRQLVQRWVAPWLAANLFLIFVGVAVPATTSAVRLVIMAVEGNAPTTMMNAASRVVGRPAKAGVRSAD